MGLWEAYNPGKWGPLIAHLANDLGGTREQNTGLGGISTRHTEYLSQLYTLGQGVYTEGTC